MSDFTVVERVDSCIIILQNLKELHLAEIINEVIPAHGNWGGLGIGETACIWITHVLCQNDHCMSHVQKWAWERRHTISGLMGFPILESDLSDDRLAIILEKLYDPENWEKIEDKINSSSIRIYGFSPEIIRLDCTTVNSDRVVTDGGLIQFGKSKDDPTRPQVKIALATLDPIGLPLTVSVVPGNCADDPLYLPVYHRARKSLGYSNLLYVGDCKMCALAIRGEIQSFHDYYLCPLSDVTKPLENFNEKLNSFATSNPNGFSLVSRTYADGTIKKIAHGFEEQVTISTVIGEKTIAWTERKIYAYSFQHAEIILNSLEERIQKALVSINEMNIPKKGRKVIKTITEAQARVKAILSKYRVNGLISVSYKENKISKDRRQYKDNPAGVDVKTRVMVAPEIDDKSYAYAKNIAGWKVFVTNKPVDELSLEQVILTYRNQWIVEDIFSRIKGKQISLDPMQLSRDDHIEGLIKFLTIVVRVQILIEVKIADKILKRKQGVTGLYYYQKKRVMNRPTIASIVKAMEGINLIISKKGDDVEIFVTDLSSIQKEILELIGYGQKIYLDVVQNVRNFI